MQVITNDGVTDIVGELPNVSLLLRNGLYFNQAWAHPVCSPTRASIYTGTHPWRNGIGSPRNNPQLPASIVTALPQMLSTDYQCGLFGKWHLGDDPGNRPTDHGWHKHIGTLGGVVGAYDNWTKHDSDDYANPTIGFTGYATSDTVQEAAGWIVNLSPEVPWFATIAFHAPHDPFHTPPSGTFTLTSGDPASPDYEFNAMAQNMDSNIGYLFAKIPEDQLSNTVVIFVGDNGSHEDIAIEEIKESIYEGGVRVPMIIADGQAVVQEMNGEPKKTPRFLAPDKLNARSRQLAHVIDLYQTIIEIADPRISNFPTAGDSHSLYRFFMQAGDQKPVRGFNFSQTFFTNGSDLIRLATIRNRDYKLNYMFGPVGSTWIPSWVGTGYRLFQYVGGGIPGSEVDPATLAPDLYQDARDGFNIDAQDNLNELLDELTTHYQATSDGVLFPRPL